LDRRAGPPPHEGPCHKKSSPAPHQQNALPSRIKKSPRLGTVRDLAEAWAEGFPANHSEIKTVAKELGTLAGNIPPRELTELHVRTLCAAWKQRLNRCTRYGRTQRLKRLLRFIADTAQTPDLLHAVRKVRRPGPREVIATPTEIADLIAAAPPWLRTIILLATFTGLRRSDCLRIAPIHYDAEKRTLTIDQKKTERTVTNPVPDNLARWLEAAQPDSPVTPYCEFYRGRTVSLQSLKRAWKAAKKKAGANPNLWLHDLRRTAAVSLYQLTKDLTAVEAFLGHASISSTASYLEHKDPAKLRPYVEQMFKPKTEVIQ
jgi:integrase